MERVSAGGVDYVLATRRDRFFRSRLYRLMIDQDLKDCGTRLIALNDTGNRLADGFQDDFADWEREQLTERTRKGKLGRVMAGKVVPNRYAPMGFIYDANSGNYRIDETRMAHVRRLFSMVAEGKSLYAVKAAFDREGIRPPGGARFWRVGTVRRIIDNDVYRPHSGEELKRLVSAEVAAGLDAEGTYGVQWYNRERWERTPGGKKAIRITANSREDWIAVPVPNAGVPREQVDAARERIKNYVRPSRAADRYWELKGIVYCVCGCRLVPHTVGKYRYYICTRYSRDGKAACEHGKNWPAEALEADVRRFALDLIRNPAVLRENIQAQADRLKETLRRPERQIGQWAEQLAAIDRKRAGYQDQAAVGLMTLDELRTRLDELEKQRAAVEGQLDRLQNTQQRLDYLDDLPGLVEDYLRDLPQLIAYPTRKRDEDAAEDGLRIYKVTPDTVQPRPEVDQEAMGRKYRGLYDDLNLKVVKTADGLEITWGLGQEFSKKCASPRCKASATTS